MQECKFKVGDKVVYVGLHSAGDKGIVERIVYGTIGEIQVWVKYTHGPARGRISWAFDYDLRLETETPKEVQPQQSFTLETCIEFLNSKGFKVTLEKV